MSQLFPITKFQPHQVFHDHSWLVELGKILELIGAAIISQSINNSTEQQSWNYGPLTWKGDIC